MKHDQLEEALSLYIAIIDDDGYVSPKGKTKYQLRMELCEFLSKHPARTQHLSSFQFTGDPTMANPEKIIRHCIRLYTDEVGKLWIHLADYYTR